MCFGLSRDLDLKAGQIAHIDKKNSNNSEDNLAFLCLKHHDEYDSTTSQRKNVTPVELKSFRDELHAAVNRALSIPVAFGNVTVPADDPYAGRYTHLEAGEDSAEIEVTPIPNHFIEGPMYAVTGLSLFGTQRKFGPNMGTLAFIGTVEDNVISHSVHVGIEGAVYSIQLTFNDGSLTVVEENYNYVHGVNVSFNGDYRRA